MDKKIEDYLHLYLGCECEYSERHFLYGEHFYLTYGTMFWAQSHTDEFKLILRNLSDMSKEEKEVVENIYKKSYNSSNGMVYNCLIESSAKKINWLRKSEFDCDGLIESGLAIDKTTLNQTT